MSAINSNPGDRDLEALRRAQRAHEPSMEEILASIRNIITDEREPARAAAARLAQLQRPAAPAFGPQIVYSKDSQGSERKEPEPPREDAQSTDAVAPKVVWSQPEAADSEADKGPPEATEGEPLLSPETDEAVVSAFDALSAALTARSAEVAEGLIREMLRPMLKEWLDSNLPEVVERLVRTEIERIGRRSP